MMALLSFKIVFLLFIKLVIISEIVCFTGYFLPNNIFSNSLSYVSKNLNSIQPQLNLQKLLIPEVNIQNTIYTRNNGGRNNVLQHIPATITTTTTTTTTTITTTTAKTNIENLKSDLSNERSNNNTTTQKTNIENKDIDEKWNSFFDNYFKNQESKTENSLITENVNNGETPQASKDIFDDKNIETTTDLTDIDITDTTPFDNETTTGDDDLLRNGVPPELLSSLLG